MIQDQYSRDRQIEQLWYTWSTTGLDSLAAGFRVRAASPGLQDVYSDQMKQLDRYLRYSLPMGSDLLNTRPEDAPASLAFVKTENQGRALINRVYTGKDGRGRPGAYFAHLLTNLPAHFTPALAIGLWHSTLWQLTDVPLQEAGTQLPYRSLSELAYTIPFEEPDILKQQFWGLDFSSPLVTSGSYTQNSTNSSMVSSTELYSHLRFLLHAYLLQQHAVDEKQQERRKVEQEIARLQQLLQSNIPNREKKQAQQDLEQAQSQLLQLPDPEIKRIILIARPDEVAFLIAALTRLLPPQLTSELTFSTYEHDIAAIKPPLHIVGTCPPPVALNRSGISNELIPGNYYRSSFVLDTYQGTQSELAEIHIPGVETIKISDYVQNAVDQLQVRDLTRLDKFFSELKDYPALDVQSFLILYQRYSRQSTLNELASYFADLSNFITIFSSHYMRQQLFLRKYYEDYPDQRDLETREQHLIWLKITLAPLFAQYHQYCTYEVSIQYYLSNKLLRSPSTMEVQSVVASLTTILTLMTEELLNAMQQVATRDDESFFMALMAVLEKLRPRAINDPTWLKLLSSLVNNDYSRAFVQNLRHWAVREYLLDYVATTVLTPDNDALVRPLLEVEPEHFGRLLAPTEVKAQHQVILQRPLRLSSDWNYLATQHFFNKVRIRASSFRKLQNDNLPVIIDVTVMEQLHKHTEQIDALVKQLNSDPRPQFRDMAFMLLLLLIYNQYRNRLSLLQSWFDATLIYPTSVSNLESILNMSNLQNSERVSILQSYGNHYLQKDETAPVILNAYRLAQKNGIPNAMDLVIKLAETQLTQQRLEKLFDNNSFTPEEFNNFLVTFSHDYAHRLGSNQSVPAQTAQSSHSPQYLVLYPGSSLWMYMLNQFGQAGLQYEHQTQALVLVYLEAVLMAFQKKRELQPVINRLLTFSEPNLQYSVPVLNKAGARLLQYPEFAVSIYAIYSNVINHIDGKRYRIELFFSLMEAQPTDYAIADRLLETAQLSQDIKNAYQFFRRFGTSYLPYCYRSPIARNLFLMLFKEPDYREEICKLLRRWLASNMKPNELEAVLRPLIQEGDPSVLYPALERSAPMYFNGPQIPPVLEELLELYLQNFDPGALLEDSMSRNFLHTLYSQRPHFSAKNKALLKDWYAVEEFVRQPSLTSARFHPCLQIIKNFSEKSYISMIDILPEALFPLINTSNDLMLVIAVLADTIPDNIPFILIRIIEHVADHLQHFPEMSQGQQRAAIYLQLAFTRNLMGLDQEMHDRMQRTLLNVCKYELLMQISILSKEWSPAARTSWRDEIESQLPPVQPTAAVQPVQQAPALVSQPAQQLPEGKGMVAVQNNSSGTAISSKKTIIPSPAFLLVFLRLRRLYLSKGQGTGQLAFFWAQHQSILQRYADLTPLDWRLRLKLCCDFYQAFQVAERTNPASLEAESQLVEAINRAHSIPGQQDILEILTTWERVRLWLAVERSGIALLQPLQLSSPPPPPPSTGQQLPKPNAQPLPSSEELKRALEKQNKKFVQNKGLK